MLLTDYNTMPPYLSKMSTIYMTNLAMFYYRCIAVTPQPRKQQLMYIPSLTLSPSNNLFDRAHNVFCAHAILFQKFRGLA